MSRAKVVRCVVVHYGDTVTTLDCINSLENQDWPRGQIEIVVVDNGPQFGEVARQLREPGVKVISAGKNLGFAGGVNAALSDLSGVDYVALLNNDAIATPTWISNLTASLEVAGERAGAVASLMMRAGKWTELRLDTGGGASRTRPAAIVSGMRIDSLDAGLPIVRDGQVGWYPGRSADIGIGLDRRSQLLVRCDAAEVQLRVHSDRSTEIRLESGGVCVTQSISAEPRWITVPTAGTPTDVCASTGLQPNAQGWANDRDAGHIGIPDRSAGEVYGWCGGAALLHREYLDDVGLFDAKLFMYAEDLDLSLRGRAKGWATVYSPNAIVTHAHAGAAGYSDRAEVLRARNLLSVALMRDSLGHAMGLAGRYLLATLWYLWRDFVWTYGKRSDAQLVRRRLKALAGYVRYIPRSLRRRRG